MADSLLNSLDLALTGALGDVFTVLSVAVVLSFPVAFFLRVRLTTGFRTDMAGGELPARNVMPTTPGVDGDQ